MNILLWVAIGAFIGWNMPQPWYAKAIQNWVVSKIQSFSKAK